MTWSAGESLQKLLGLLVEQMLKGNLFDLKMTAGDSSDTRAGGGEGQSHPLESAKWIEKSSPKISL